MKKVLFIALPVLVLGGGFVGLAVSGVIKVPGLTPRKPKVQAMYGETPAAPAKKETDAPVAQKPPAKKEPIVTVATAKSDPEAGNKKLAQLWNGMPTPKLVALAKSFKDNELAVVLIKMDPEKVAEFLTALEPGRSAKLSKELQKAAAVDAAKS